MYPWKAELANEIKCTWAEYCIHTCCGLTPNSNQNHYSLSLTPAPHTEAEERIEREKLMDWDKNSLIKN